MKHNFKRLDIWISSMELVEKTYLIIKEIPNDERFGLKSHMSRAVVSIPSNIAEGSGRNSNKGSGHFLSISIGSIYELETQLLLLRRLFDITTENLVDQCQHLQRMMISSRSKLITTPTNV